MYTVYVKPFPHSKVNEKTAAAVFPALHLQKGVKTHRENVYNRLTAQHIRLENYTV